MPHTVFVQKILNDFAAGCLVGDAESLVFDVRPQTVGVDLDGGLQWELQVFLNAIVSDKLELIWTYQFKHTIQISDELELI